MISMCGYHLSKHSMASSDSSIFLRVSDRNIMVFSKVIMASVNPLKCLKCQCIWTSVY